MDDLRSIVAAGNRVPERRVLRRCLVHLHRIGAHVRRSVVLVLRLSIGDAVDARQLVALVRLRQFRIPPLMLGVDHVRLDAVVQIGRLANLAPRALDPNPVALLDSKLGSRFGIDLHTRHRPQFAAPRQLAMFRVEVHGNAPSGDTGNGIFLVRFRIRNRTVRGLCIVGQRLGREAGSKLGTIRSFREERLDGRTPELVLHGGRRETRLVNIQLNRLLMGSRPIRLAHFVTTIRSPVFWNLALHIPPAVLLERRLQLVPVLERRRPLHAALDREVFDLEIDTGLVLEPWIVAIERRHAEVLRQLHEIQRVALAFAGRIDGFHAQPEPAGGALGDAVRVDLGPVANRQKDVGSTRRGRMPQVGLEQEVEHVERFPIVFRVPHVHVVARADHATMNLIGRIRLLVRAVHGGIGIAPHTVPV